MEHRTVRLTHDHIARQARCTPERAIEEAIWNALDAGGQEVEVVFELDKLSTCKAIEVRDHGIGIPISLVDQAFGTIGESPKAAQRQTPEGRALHGNEGRGRFKSLVIGKRATWTTRYEEDAKIWQYSIAIERLDESSYSISALEPAGTTETGTTLRVEGLEDNVGLLRSREVRDGLTGRLALYLKSYPDVVVIYDGKRIDPSCIIARQELRRIDAPEGQTEVAELEIIEWKQEMGAKRLFVCDPRGFVWHEMLAGVHAPGLNLTAYLKCGQARDWHETGQFGLAEMDPIISAYVDTAKDHLRDYRRNRLGEQARDVVEQWKKDKVYPYPDDAPKDLIERAERQVFDIVASRVHEYHEPLRGGDPSSKKLTLSLVKQALETNPTSLRKILENALSLPKEKQDELADLLEITNFDAIIEAARTVTQRLDVIHGFETLIFDDDWRKRLRERTQLHRLLVHELWVFGEEYTLDSDDDPWKHVLKQHIAKLGRESVAEDVDIGEIDGIDKIPDLLLSRRFIRGKDMFENLVIELKRPSVKIGGTEIMQIEQYANLVARESIFDKRRVRWTFMVVGREFDDHGEMRAGGGPTYGCIYEGGNLTIWVKRWSELLHDAKLRYEFFRERLQVEASATRGFDYLNKNYEHLLTGTGMTKKGERDAGKLESKDEEAIEAAD